MMKQIFAAVFAILFVILQNSLVACKPFTSRFNFAEIENELQNFHQNPFEAEKALYGNEEISEKDLELLGLIGKELKEMRRSIPQQFFLPSSSDDADAPDAGGSGNNGNIFDYKIHHM